MRSLFIIILFTCCCGAVCGQDSTRFSVHLKLHPFAALGRSSIMGSLEFLFKDKAGIEFGYGRRYNNDFLLHDSDKLDTLTVKPAGQTRFLEFTLYDPFSVKPHLLLKGLYVHFYVGAVYRHFTDFSNDVQYYWSHLDTAAGPRGSTVDYFATYRKVNIMALKAGFVFRVKAFSAEQYIELGARHKHLALIGNEFDPQKDTFANGLWPWERPYHGWLPTINVFFKVNYRLFKL